MATGHEDGEVKRQSLNPKPRSNGQVQLARGGRPAASGSIAGTVYDKATNKPIAGAKVMVSGCRNYATTGNDGTYTITGLADGSHTVKAMKSGYECATFPTPVVISGGQPVTGIDFLLIPTFRALD